MDIHLYIEDFNAYEQLLKEKRFLTLNDMLVEVQHCLHEDEDADNVVMWPIFECLIAK